jgi:hypothetical protein
MQNKRGKAIRKLAKCMLRRKTPSKGRHKSTLQASIEQTEDETGNLAKKHLSLRAEHSFSKTQNAEKTVLLCKSLGNRSTKRIKNLIDLANLSQAMIYSNSSHPNTNVAIRANITEKQTAVTIRKSLR